MYLNLKKNLRKKRISHYEVSMYLSIHPNSFSNKINGKTSFTVEEAFKIKERYFPRENLQMLFQDYS